MEPLVVAYGMGVDSTAMLVEMHRRGIRPDLILFADTGGEKPRTYAYLAVIQRWLRKVGFPEVIVVRKTPVISKKHGAAYRTLEEESLVSRYLPSLAYGRHKCSLKWKVAPQDAYVATWQPALDAWAAGHKVRKAIGYDNGPADGKRAGRMATREDPRYDYWYPLREWGLDRDACIRAIAEAGLPVPVKSACFFCPAMKKAEIEDLAEKYPDLAERALAIEAAARSNPANRTPGLGRTFAWGDHLAAVEAKERQGILFSIPPCMMG